MFSGNSSLSAGPIMRISIFKEKPTLKGFEVSGVEVLALVDTGAFCSLVSTPVIQELGIAASGEANFGGAHNIGIKSQLYSCFFGLRKKATASLWFKRVDVASEGFGWGGVEFNAVIGRDLLRFMHFEFGPEGDWKVRVK